MPALALTDVDAQYGAIRLAQTAKSSGIRPIFGSQLTLDTGDRLTVLVQNETGWKNLCKLITIGRGNAQKGYSKLPFAELEGKTEGLFALYGGEESTLAQLLRAGDGLAVEQAQRYLNLFGKNHFWIELSYHPHQGSIRLARQLKALADYLHLDVVATNNVHYALPHDHELQDVLVAIEHNQSIEEVYSARLKNSEYYLKSAAQMGEVFSWCPEAVSNTLHIAEQCEFLPRYGLQDLPQRPTPHGQSADEHLQAVCTESLRTKYPGKYPALWERLDHELGIIRRRGLANYFLLVWGFARFAREQDIYYGGRGSSASSVTAFALDITHLNPLDFDLPFERFLADETQLMPDIDIDFENSRREEVIQKAYQEFGNDHVAMACTFPSFRLRSSLRDVAKALGLPPEAVDGLATDLERFDDEGVGDTRFERAKHSPEYSGHIWQHLFDLCERLQGFPDHLSIHSGGMIFTASPITDYVPVEPAALPGRTVTHWDKDQIEDSGLIKVDFLGLASLAASHETITLVKETTGEVIDPYNFPLDDPSVFQMIAAADTFGVFQVESRAISQILPLLNPQEFNGVKMSISLMRPGPIQANAVHPYIRRVLGYEPVIYPDPSLVNALQGTLGVLIFQEGVLKICRDFAGMTPGDGEVVRRTLARNTPTDVERVFGVFSRGARERGRSQEKIEEVFSLLKAFAGYAFPESHSVMFAYWVMLSARLKRYHSRAFLVGLLNNQPMGFWSPAALVNDAKRHGIQILNVSLEKSSAKCTLERKAVRLGFTYVDGIGKDAAKRIEEARNAKPFENLADFCRRTQVRRRAAENLIMVGAMDHWTPKRHKLLWELGEILAAPNELGLVFGQEAIELPELTQEEALIEEREILGMTLGEHPITFYREKLSQYNVRSSADLPSVPSGERVRVAGSTLSHQAPPTAKGFHFLTLEDECGLLNIIIRPDVYKKYRHIIRHETLLVATGRMQREGQVINILAEHFQAIPHRASF